MRSIVSKEELFQKFEADVLMAEKLTGGSQEIFVQIEEESNKRRIDYSNLGFGPPKPKKKKEDLPKKLGSDISQAVRYKKDQTEGGAKRVMKLEHETFIREQPHVENMKEDLKKACNSYVCYTCGFKCTRLGVIVWHNKNHLKTVIDYDTGIRIPGRKKIRARPFRNRRPGAKKDRAKQAAIDHSKTNGHASAEAQQLLDDWDDEDEEQAEEPQTTNGIEEAATDAVSNGLADDSDGEDSNDDDDCDDDDDDEVNHSNQTTRSRVPMRGVDDLNSAFDALLADTPTNSLPFSSRNENNEFTNNDSDSDGSDWEKYYDKGSDGEDEEEPGESDIKSLCEEVTSTVTNGNCNGDGVVLSDCDGAVLSDEDKNNHEGEEEDSNSPHPSTQPGEDAGEEDESLREETGRSSSLSSSPSNSTGPAYMLVAVDAHGNNVPMPALTDRLLLYNIILLHYIILLTLYYTRLPVTRWVKLSLNFELLVPKYGNEIFIRLTPF